ncbi:hypothetical protein MC7420_949 [Coleofasciculus chthonoplastes PCC 7420]|uniref:Uncharacterized protein n=1 Tax=Coleofasciculus chthonoplastes PCC 7420 TaxID=118168 RepID=B4W0I9_9CYAN|nr:hypothetical protein MC7420_949 [Coleofasciculus chthonoplastes PCC 7420]
MLVPQIAQALNHSGSDLSLHQIVSSEDGFPPQQNFLIFYANWLISRASCMNVESIPDKAFKHFLAKQVQGFRS